ncbi:hypothetical protein HRI_003576600 [Hibiscus trionum]|uniref:Uncharacterized protein n=1 Tax=Hibiscus trionum TaxID=183268 RepID=A0A9W7IPQ4_HIBTR|nr:hypothetical protein HRI_003576600 [Hibiscus trionum]
MSLTRTLADFHLSPTLSSLFEDSEMSFSFDVFEPTRTLFTSFPSPFDPAFDAITDVICLSETPFSSHYRRISGVDELKLRSAALLSPISGLGLAADRFKQWDRKYTWKDEIKGEADRKYQYTAEIKGSEGGKYKWTAEVEGPEKKYSWTAEIKGKKDGDAAKRRPQRSGSQDQGAGIS